MTKRITFKQYFTPPPINYLLVNEAFTVMPNIVLDLSMGEGSLLLAALEKWPKCQLVGNDLDPDCIKIAQQHIPKLISLNQDLTSQACINLIHQTIGKVDVCLGNPPFNKIKVTEEIQQLFNEYNLSRYAKLEKIPAEIIFILQAIKVLKPSGELIAILPDGIFVNQLRVTTEFGKNSTLS